MSHCVPDAGEQPVTTATTTYAVEIEDLAEVRA